MAQTEMDEVIELLPSEKEKQVLALVDPFEIALSQMAEQAKQFETVTSENIEDAKRFVKQVKVLPGRADKKRLEIFRPINDLMKTVKSKTDAFADRTQKLIQPISDRIEAEQLRIEQEKHARHVERTRSLVESGWTLMGQMYHCGVNVIGFEQIDNATDEVFAEYIRIGKQFQESERIRLAEIERRERELEERERRIKEAEARLFASEEESDPDGLFPEPKIVKGAVVNQEIFNGESFEPLTKDSQAEILGYAPSIDIPVEFNQGWNAALDAVVLAMQSETAKQPKTYWIEKFNQLKK